MKVQPPQIRLYLFVIGVIRDRRFEPGGETGNFFSSAGGANYSGAKMGIVFRRGGYKVCKARAVGKALLEVGRGAAVPVGGCGGECTTGLREGGEVETARSD